MAEELTTLICTHLKTGRSKDEQGVQIPNDALCPISLELMEDPVMCADGHSYERAAITKWLKKNQKSPMTGKKLTNKKLTPNITLRKMIEALQI